MTNIVTNTCWHFNTTFVVVSLSQLVLLWMCFSSVTHTHANTDSQDENGNSHIVAACNDTSSAIMTVNESEIKFGTSKNRQLGWPKYWNKYGRYCLITLPLVCNIAGKKWHFLHERQKSGEVGGGVDDSKVVVWYSVE